MRTVAAIALAACCTAVVLLVHAAASAQEVPKRRPLTAPAKPAAAGAPMAAPMAVPASGPQMRRIELTLNRAEVITLPGRVSEIVIGNPRIADVEIPEDSESAGARPSRVFIRPTAVGSTNVFFIGADGNIIEQMEINVVFDSANIKSALRKLLPGENIDVSVFRDSVFLTGKVHSAAAVTNAVNIAGRFVGTATNVVNMMSVVGGQQVILKVRVAEMDRNVRKNLSAEGFTQLQSWSRGIQFSTVAPTFQDTSFATGTLFTGTNKIGDRTFEALERQSLAKTLAEPTLTAVSGESASFLSGGEFPFPSGLDENGQTIFEFREFGIRLEFTPVVIDKRRINLRVSTEISSIGDVALTTASLSINQIDSKRTETTIELPSGGTLMIAGLLQDDMSDTINGVPYLKDVPVLGALFRSTAFTQQESELVITVTAYLAKPIGSAAEASLPTDGFEPASDLDIYLLGRLHRHYGDSKLGVLDDLVEGPFGYIMK